MNSVQQQRPHTGSSLIVPSPDRIACPSRHKAGIFSSGSIISSRVFRRAMVISNLCKWMIASGAGAVTPRLHLDTAQPSTNPLHQSSAKVHTPSDLSLFLSAGFGARSRSSTMGGGKLNGAA